MKTRIVRIHICSESAFEDINLASLEDTAETFSEHMS